MTPTLAVVMVLMGIAIGWMGHGLWLKRPVRGELYEHPGCYPVNDPWDPEDPITKAMMNGESIGTKAWAAGYERQQERRRG